LSPLRCIIIDNTDQYLFRRQHRSPLYQVAEALKDVAMEELETINPCTLAPWAKRVQTITDESASTQLGARWGVRIAVSSSARNGIVGMGGVIEIHKSARSNPGNEILSFSSTLGTRDKQNPYSGELAAMANALNTLPKLRFRSIVLITRNKAAVSTLRKPQQQSGQEHICRFYGSIRALRRNGNTITVSWLPSGESNELIKLAKDQAKIATRQGSIPQKQLPRTRSTTFNIARAKRSTTRRLPENVGKYSKRIDKALPGKHTQPLYDQLSRKEASVLAQLRTGMARLNSYLYRIRASSTDQCACGEARETVDHFLFRCRRWTAQRTELLQCTETHRGNISFCLGGKTRMDNENWAPNMKAVRAAIRFAIATGRLDANQPQANQDLEPTTPI
jgi:hypothetical protein